MPLSKAIARFNRRVTNPLLGRLAGWLPPLAIVVHRGRRTGRAYRTPVMAFPAGGEVVIALTYGPEVDWLRNLLAAGGGRLIYRRRELIMGQPRLVTTPTPPPALPAPVRLALPLLRVDHYVVAMIAPAADS